MPEPTVFNGRYELHRRLGRGGMAEVFLARDLLLDRPVAVKVLFPEFANDPSFVDRFRREAQAAANLNHPNIVGVYDWGQEDGTYFIVMEYVDGRSLADDPPRRGPAAARPRPPSIATDVAAALGFAHRNGVRPPRRQARQHPHHPGGQVKVADFGIARAIDAAVEENLTQTGAVMGTATYFSPEQAQGLAGRPPQRPLLARRRALRDAHRPAAVQRRQPGGHRLQARAGGTRRRSAQRQPRRARPSSRRSSSSCWPEAPGRPLRRPPRTCAPTCAATARASGSTPWPRPSPPPARRRRRGRAGRRPPPPVAPTDRRRRARSEPDDDRAASRTAPVVGASSSSSCCCSASSPGCCSCSPTPSASATRTTATSPTGRGARASSASPSTRPATSLEDAGFEVDEAAEQVADAAQVGSVLDQDPEAGIRVDEGSDGRPSSSARQNTFAMPPLGRLDARRRPATPSPASASPASSASRGAERRRRRRPDHHHRAGGRRAGGHHRHHHAGRLERAAARPRCPTCDGVTERDCADRLTGAGFTPAGRCRSRPRRAPPGQVIRTEPGRRHAGRQRRDRPHRRLGRARRRRRAAGRGARPRRRHPTPSRTPASTVTVEHQPSRPARRRRRRASTRTRPATPRRGGLDGDASSSATADVGDDDLDAGDWRLARAAGGGDGRASWRTRSWPPAVRIDSGWNCTPSTSGARGGAGP